MEPLIIDGKRISKEIKDELKVKVADYKSKGIEITLAVIQIGDDPASTVYVRNKKKACEYIGINSRSYELPDTTSEDELLDLIDELNNDPKVNGILVQLPVPDTFDPMKVINAISPKKDVDGFSPYNYGSVSIGCDGYASCTPEGIIELFRRSNIDIDGKHCVIIGRSNIVGKPMASLMLNKNATVTLTHSHTRNLKEICKSADILIVAIGKKEFVTSEYVKKGAVVIDVGIHRDENNKLTGDVDYEDVAPHCSAITPVPGGVGPMTIAMLMYNCVKSVELISE